MFKLFQENKTIQWLLDNYQYIDFDPDYQRLGNIWSKSQKQLLIDSIFNGFDIPKLYFHFLPASNGINNKFNYAVIDGKQRLETIIEFINNNVTLPPSFKFYDDKYNDYYKSIAGKTYTEIEIIEPSALARFLQYELCIVFIDTNEIDTINETFIRLNSGVNVNTAEKRNASGGELSKQIKYFYKNSDFFVKSIRINNTRYAHFDLALKLLMTEMGYKDLSKSTVNEFVLNNKNFNDSIKEHFEKMKNKINRLSAEFDYKDVLLSKKSLIITLYSLLDKIPIGKAKIFMKDFESKRALSNSEQDKTKIDANMVEFSRLLQQGADKQISLVARKNIMEKYLEDFLLS